MRKFIAAATTMAALAAGMLSVGVAPASAGTNGQQVQICSNSWKLTGGRADLRGVNEKVTWTEVNGISFATQTCRPLAGYWWVGTVYLHVWDKSGVYRGVYLYEVPKSQNGDWTYIQFDG